MTPGAEIKFVNSAPAPFPGSYGEGVVRNVMKFIVTDGVGHTAALPSSLRPIERMLETDADEFRDFVLEKQVDYPSHPCEGGAWLINGKAFTDITELPKLGSTEVWNFINKSGMAHPMHMHGVPFQVVEINGERFSGALRDTVLVPPHGGRVTVAFDATNAGNWVMHCHNLYHMAAGMMTTLTYVA